MERTDSRHHRMVNVLRSREQLDDVFESQRLSAAHQISPIAATAGTGNSAPSPAAPPAAHPESHPR
ncbi:hypothetical protein ACWEIK_26200 [Streptomyces sp. NPDC004673]